MTASTISNRLGVAWRRRKDIFTNYHLITESEYHEAVCRTAPAASGLLKSRRADVKKSWRDNIFRIMLFKGSKYAE